MRKELAAESDAAKKQIAELEARARAAAAEREALLKKAWMLYFLVATSAMNVIC